MRILFYFTIFAEINITIIMTEQEHKILVENNLMLKEIIMYLYKNSQDDTFRQFVINVLADKVANNIQW